MKISVEIDTKTWDCNFLGELLRNYLFVNDGNEKYYTRDKNYKMLGCYETFEVRKDAQKLSLADIKHF